MGMMQRAFYWKDNELLSDDGVINRGYKNILYTFRSYVGDGDYNKLHRDGNKVLFGDYNEVTKERAVVLAGNRNIIDGWKAVITKGDDNTIKAELVYIGFGDSNQVSGAYSCIGYGNGNTISNGSAYIGYGCKNVVSGQAAAISYGTGNTLTARSGYVGRGNSNSIVKSAGVVLYGSDNKLSAARAMVVNGNRNNITGTTSAVVYGDNNKISGKNSLVIAGDRNTVSHERAILLGMFGKNSGFDGEISSEFMSSEIESWRSEWLMRATGADVYFTADGVDGGKKWPDMKENEVMACEVMAVITDDSKHTIVNGWYYAHRPEGETGIGEGKWLFDEFQKKLDNDAGYIESVPAGIGIKLKGSSKTQGVMLVRATRMIYQKK